MSEHTVDLARIRLGRSVLYNRPLYGYNLVCSCGWRQQVNGNKRVAIVAANDHVRRSPYSSPEVWGSA